MSLWKSKLLNESVWASGIFRGDNGIFQGDEMDNFSYYEIRKLIIIPLYQQMIVADECVLIEGGLNILGELILII